MACAPFLLAACGAGDAPPPPARPYADPGFVDAGAHRIYYALTPTAELASEIAGSYGIVPRRNLALLTIALASAERAPPGASRMDATAIMLTGQRLPLALARHDSASGPTWLATLELRDREPVTIEIRARLDASAPAFVARFTRTLHLD